MKLRVLITGGAGFIGFQTANELIAAGYDVRVFDRLCGQVHPNPKFSLARLHPAVKFICGDIRNRVELEAALEGVDAVYHFAAETGVGQSMYEIERYSDVNIRGTAVLCDCIAKMKRRPSRIILSSSRAVYGEGEYVCITCGRVYPDQRDLAQLRNGNWNLLCPVCGGNVTSKPCQETIPCRPVSVYGLTKKVQEDLHFHDR